MKNYLLLVNKDNEFNVKDIKDLELVKLQDVDGNDSFVEKQTYEAYNQLKEGMKQFGIETIFRSAGRTTLDQVYCAFDAYVDIYAGAARFQLASDLNLSKEEKNYQVLAQKIEEIKQSSIMSSRNSINVSNYNEKTSSKTLNIMLNTMLNQFKMKFDTETKEFVSKINGLQANEEVQKIKNNCETQINARWEPYVAKPGQSEHHTGLAIDINVANMADNNLKKDEMYEKLANQLPKYGFILRYTVANSGITKYNAEKWHARFVGTPELAEEITKIGSLEDYIKLQKAEQQPE